MSIDTIWYTRCPVPTAFAIAVKLGWLDEEFERDGIVFRSLASSLDPVVRQSHFAHTQPNSTRHGGAIPPLVTRSRGRDLRLVGLSVTSWRQQVLALPGSGIKGAADLKGRRLSIPRRVNDPIDFWRATVLRGFDLVLSQAGLTFDDVVPVDFQIQRRFIDDATATTDRSEILWNAGFMLGYQRDEAAALLRGDVDAIFTQGGGGVTVLGYTGARVVAEVDDSGDDLASFVNNQPFTLTVSGALADVRPDIPARLVARVREAAGWAHDNEREAKRIIAAETGLPEQFVDHAYGPKVHQQLDIDLTPRRVAALQTLHDDLLSRDFLARPLDLDAFIDRRPLAGASDFARRAA
ncbi:MAG TPA: ABC transporter substrate-binding protein [Stellaceae bacterium]|nr:ABC transporter substrate-binding protein [Stellaceae bacterium]